VTGQSPRSASRRRTKAAAPDVARIAAVVQRLAVLLAAGVAPVSAWGYLREGALSERIADDAARGTPIPDAIIIALTRAEPLLPPPDDAAWRGLATAWAVATDAGAPLAPTLRESPKRNAKSTSPSPPRLPPPA
jgi:tight adherence protein B